MSHSSSSQHSPSGLGFQSWLTRTHRAPPLTKHISLTLIHTQTHTIMQKPTKGSLSPFPFACLPYPYFQKAINVFLMALLKICPCTPAYVLGVRLYICLNETKLNIPILCQILPFTSRELNQIGLSIPKASQPKDLHKKIGRASCRERVSHTG